jgi:hypothetical protein
VVVCPDDVFHAADVGVVEQADNGGFAGSAHLLGVVCPLAVGGALVLVCRLAGHDLDGDLSRGLVFLQLEPQRRPPVDMGLHVPARPSRSASPA